MTAILQPGDKIHLAFGVDSGLTREEGAEQATRIAQQLGDAYALQGVTVMQWTSNNHLTHPVIVAIFRDPA